MIAVDDLVGTPYRIEVAENGAIACDMFAAGRLVADSPVEARFTITPTSISTMSPEKVSCEVRRTSQQIHRPRRPDGGFEQATATSSDSSSAESLRLDPGRGTSVSARSSPLQRSVAWSGTPSTYSTRDCARSPRPWTSTLHQQRGASAPACGVLACLQRLQSRCRHTNILERTFLGFSSTTCDKRAASTPWISGKTW